MSFRPTFASAELPDGAMKMFVDGDTNIAIYRVDGELYATDNLCPHAGASLAHGFLDGCVVTCRIHHWRFDITDGKYLDSADPRYQLRTYVVRETDGFIEVDLD